MAQDSEKNNAAATGAGKGKDAPHSFTIALERVKDYEFRVRFDKEQYQDLLMDEPPPLGADGGPSASRVLAAAVGNCLCASLVFCYRKARVELKSLSAEVTLEYKRNEQGRTRIGRIGVELSPVFGESDPGRLQRCLEIFEDFCVVTQSVRQGIEIGVSVRH